MQEYLICTDGKKRKAVKIICENCGKEHLFRQRNIRNPQYRFCSAACGSAFRKKSRQQVQCAWCKKEFTKSNSKCKNSRSGLHFCNRKCKDEAQKLGGIKEIQPPHFGTRTRKKPGPRKSPSGGKHRRLFKTEEIVCARCGYKEFLCSVDVHHKDFNHENNAKENLLPLCANCHRGLHYNKWKLEELLQCSKIS